MDSLIRILHLEDDPVDAELVKAKLEEAGLSCRMTRVQTRDEFDEALRQEGYDIILADYRLPMYDGMSALRLAQELRPDVPFIFVSGTMGEEAAIEGLTNGATDYVLKQRLLRLAQAVKRALHDAENWPERKRAEKELRASPVYHTVLSHITERKHVEEALRASEERHRAKTASRPATAARMGAFLSWRSVSNISPWMGDE